MGECYCMLLTLTNKVTEKSHRHRCSCTGHNNSEYPPWIWNLGSLWPWKDIFCYISAHSIAAALGTERSQGLHAFSGCDKVSAFCGINGKKTVWEVWQSSEVWHFSANSLILQTNWLMVTWTSAHHLCRKSTRHEKGFLLLETGKWKIFPQPLYYSIPNIYSGRACVGPNTACKLSPADWDWVKEEDIWLPIIMEQCMLPEASKACREMCLQE